ncbi:MAG: hypothetical protein IJP75_09100 [Bacteroidaceae bacterium]|nr:hypothetical protein [Bacteroidaceae bacterium]
MKNLKYIYLFIFIAAAFLLLPVMNGDYLYTIQDNNVFISGHTFMMDIVQHAGGWITWAACYLTQFFYYPWLGSTILILLWVAIYWITIWMFGISNKFSFLALIVPLLLLYHLLDYGYWIYYAKAPAFPFVPTLTILFCLLFTWGILFLTRNLKISWRWKGLLALGLLGIIMVIINWLSPSSPWHFNYNYRHSIMTTLTDKNFRHELRMYRALDEFRFDDVLKEMPADNEKAPTNLMVMYKNIALMHTGRITDMFKTNNCGINPFKNDSLPIYTSQLGAPLIYYQFGQINYAYRWAMENAVVYGQSFRNLKMMARCAIFNQEFDLAMKYIAMLKSSIYYRDWAKEREAWMANSTNFIQHKEFQTIAPLLCEDINMLDEDEGRCEKYILDHFSDLRHPTSPLLEDVIMCLSLWTEDGYAFCIHFYDYVQNHPNQPIPELYQQGAILYGNTQDAPITTRNFKFDTIVSEKYNRFAEDYNELSQQELDTQEMAKRMKPTYGDTYWWYYYFYTDFTIY